MHKTSISLLLIVSVLLLGGCSKTPHVEWTEYTPEKMAEVMASGKPVFAYFYAAWCHPCMMLKEHTFSDPRIIAELEPYHRIKVDMSFIHSEKIQKISEDYKILGMPTLILFGPDGKEAFHQSGYLTAEELLGILQKFRTEYGLPEPAAPKKES